MTNMKMMTACLMIAMIVAVSHAYSPGKIPNTKPNVDRTLTRQNFFKQAAAGLGVVMVTQPAWAKDKNAAEGTKKDPIFEQCLSQCEFEMGGLEI